MLNINIFFEQNLLNQFYQTSLGNCTLCLRLSRCWLQFKNKNIFYYNFRYTFVPYSFEFNTHASDMELGHWVTGSMGHLGHLSRPGHWVTLSSFWPGVRPEFFRFSKKCPKCKTYIWNAEMTKFIVRCLLLDWNHWMSVHANAMNFYFYLWLVKILWPENTFSWRQWRHCSIL